MIEITVCYPALADIILRTSHNWEADVLPTGVSADGTERTFQLEPTQTGQLYFKAVRRDDGRWSAGANYLAVAGRRTVYPHFDGAPTGRITDKLVVGKNRMVRVFVPPGYDENHLKRYPVLYMLDGANVFFPDEAFSGQDWAIDATMDCLNAMNMVDKVIVVALYSIPDEREGEYTAPGYFGFGAELVEEVLPDVAERWRVLDGPENTAIMGSSLGGVTALHLCWQHPSHFGMAACISSTFGFRDDLLRRIWTEPKRKLRIYLDSGWPGDNHAQTMEVHDALVARGFAPGTEVLFLGFPGALHHEKAWAQRVHLPIQFFFGRAFTSTVESAHRT